jgi:hypothetical protein
MQDETSTSTGRTGQHGRRTHEQRSPHGAHCIEGGLAEEGSATQADKQKEAGEEANLIQM